MSGNEKNKTTKYVLEAPDGGWGYMIAIAVVLNLGITSMFGANVSLIYNDFMQELGMSTTNATLMNGITSISFAISGFLVSPLLIVMSLRTTLLLGVTIFNIGILGNVFSNSIVAFIFCQGVMQGVGYGVIFNISNTLLNDYFVKNRLMAIGLVQTLIGVLTMAVPMFLKWSLEEFGLRGTVLLILGITMHSFIGVALVQPVAWHMKKVEVSVDSNDEHLELPLLVSKSNDTQVHKLINADSSLHKPLEKTYDYDLSVEEKESHPLKSVIKSILDKELAKKCLMSCLFLGPSLSIFADINFCFMLPQALYKNGWNQDSVALAISLLAFGDLAMRIIYMLFSKFVLKLGIQEIYILSLVVGLVSRLGMLWSKNPIVILVYITIIGVSHCSIVILIPMVIADAVTPEIFSAAMGMFMMLSGTMNLVLGPALGAVRDLTNSYGAVFYLITSCFAMVILFWSIEICYKKNKHKRLQRLEYLKQKKSIKG